MTAGLETHSSAPAQLAAYTGPDGTYFEGEGQVLAGLGEHRRWSVEQDALRAGWDEVGVELRRRAAASDAPGNPEVAFFALPFDRSSPASVWIPEDLAWWRPTGWLRRPAWPWSAPAEPAEPARISVAADQSPQRWRAAVRAAVDRIKAGDLDKVVLARRIAVDTETPIAPATVLTRLRRRFAANYLFAFAPLVGASPELLVGRQDGEFFASPAAGTMPRRTDPEADERSRTQLATQPKFRAEHEVLRAEMLDAFRTTCREVRVADEPVVYSTPTVHHLISPIRGTARPDAPGLLTFAARLHPTAAVCGRPRDAAYALVRELEPSDRGLYCGAVGWVDADGNGRAVVAIRCVEFTGPRAVIHVGNGIVAGSDPDQELAETRDKLQGLIEAVVMP